MENPKNPKKASVFTQGVIWQGDVSGFPVLTCDSERYAEVLAWIESDEFIYNFCSFCMRCRLVRMHALSMACCIHDMLALHNLGRLAYSEAISAIAFCAVSSIRP